MKKSNVAGLRDDYGHEPLLDEDLKNESSEFHGISDDHHESRAQAELEDGDYKGQERRHVTNVRRDQPSVK